MNLNTVTDDGMVRDESTITALKVPVKVADDVSIEAMPRRIFANAHTYHINSISVNSDDCTYLSADDLRINLWDLERTDQSFSILVNVHTCNCGHSLSVSVSLSHLLPPPLSLSLPPSLPPSHTRTLCMYILSHSYARRLTQIFLLALILLSPPPHTNVHAMGVTVIILWYLDLPS